MFREFELQEEASKEAYAMYNAIRRVRGLLGQHPHYVLGIEEAVRSIDALCYLFDDFTRLRRERQQKGQ